MAALSRSAARWQAPLQWPDAGRAAGHRDWVKTERLLKTALVLAMVALTVLDRFGLRVIEDFAIPPGMVAMYGLVAAMWIAGVATLDPRGALGYLAVAGAAALSFVVNASFGTAQYISFASFVLLLVLYVPFAVSLAPQAFAPALWHWTVRTYVAFSLLLALAGIAQFFAQFAFRPEWLFDYTSLIPLRLRASGGWATVSSAGTWLRSNGFFLREPSIFSVAMAFALLCELGTRRRVWAIATLAFALALTYSGSGLVALAVAMLFPLGWRSLVRVLACGLVAAALYLLFAEALNLTFTLERMEEIDSDTSAYCRFIYPGVMVLQQLGTDPWTSVLGHGPGAMVRMGATCGDWHQPTYGKLMFEYGATGVLAFGLLIVGALRRSAVPLGLRVALGVMWLLGGNLTTSEVVLVIYVLCAMWPKRADQPLAS